MYEEERKCYASSASGHSNALGYDYKGNKVVSVINGVCLANITQRSAGFQVSHLFLFVAFDRQKYNKGWLEWLLNESFFKDVFITKDVKEGFKTGFEIDTKQDYGLLSGAMIMFKYPFEHTSFSWSEWRDYGFDPYESYALGTNFRFVEGDSKLYWCNNNYNHKLIQRCYPYPLYEFKGYKPTGQNLYDGLIKKWDYICTNTFGCKHQQKENGFHFGGDGPVKFNSINLNDDPVKNGKELLNVMKQKQYVDTLKGVI